MMSVRALRAWRTLPVCLFLLAGHYVLVTSHCLAAVPRTIHYQGKLTEPDGSPLVGEHTVTLRLYDARTEGTQLWKEQHAVSLTRADNGVFAVTLGTGTPFGEAISFNDPLWLTVEVDGGGEFAPRQPLSAVGYAINADLLDGLDSQQLRTIKVKDLPAHAATHQPVGSDPLPPHLHDSLHSIAASGQPPLLGEVVLEAGPNVTLSQSNQTITIASTGGGATGAARVSAAASNAVTIGTGADTTLLSVTITTSQPMSALLIIASVQLNHSGNPTNKTVDVKLFRGGTQLDAAYTARIGTANRSVSELPVTLHAWDAPGAGAHTVTVRALSSATGAEATVRRLTVIEVL